MESEVVVTKKGQTTIPAKLRKKFKIEEGTRLANQLKQTKESCLNLKSPSGELFGTGAPYATVEEIETRKLTDSGKKMPNRVYDTRFLVEYLYSKDSNFRKRAEVEKVKREKYISAVSVHELYRITLSREGREMAKLRVTIVRESFKVIPVDEQIAPIIG